MALVVPAGVERPGAHHGAARAAQVEGDRAGRGTGPRGLGDRGGEGDALALSRGVGRRGEGGRGPDCRGGDHLAERP